jgi:hypothetical protein
MASEHVVCIPHGSFTTYEVSALSWRLSSTTSPIDVPSAGQLQRKPVVLRPWCLTRTRDPT